MFPYTLYSPLTNWRSGCTYLRKSYLVHTKKLLAPRVPPMSAQQEEMVLTVHLVEIGTTTARRTVVPLASSGHNSLALDGEGQETRPRCRVYDSVYLRTFGTGSSNMLGLCYVSF